MPDPIPPSEPIKEQPRQQKETERPPMRVSFRAFRVTPQQPLPQDIQQQFNDFSERQVRYVESSDIKPGPNISNEEDRILGAAWNNVAGWETFRDSLGMNPEDPTFRTTHPADVGFLVLSRDTAGNILGFSSVLMNAKTPGEKDTQPENSMNVDTAYVGVDPSEEYQGRGIGLRCATLRNLLLAREGIHNYETSVWEGSIHMYERSGLDMKTLADLSEFGTTDNKRLQITLDQQKLDALAQQLGLDPHQNPLDTEIQQELK